mgnify:CR=1 FL=1
MSLRGSKTTEAISKRAEKHEIATLPSVARNDEGVLSQAAAVLPLPSSFGCGSENSS